MGVKVGIEDGFGTGLTAHVHKFPGTDSKHAGVLVLTEPFRDKLTTVTPLLSETFGADMNQNVTFSGNPELIFDGQSTSADTGTTSSASAGNLVDVGQNFETTVTVGMGVHNSTDDTYAHVDTVTDNENLAISVDIMDNAEVYAVGNFWIPTANAGDWDFSDSTKVTITAANSGDSATFDDGGTIDMSGFTAITGKIDLDTYNDSTHSILIQFGLAGVPLGSSVNLNDYIDTGDFAEQSFVIPKADLGISTSTVDEMTITMIRTGGAKPTVKFDDFQIEQTGSPAAFSYRPSSTQRVKLISIKIVFADNVTATSSYNALFGVSALSIGINVIAQSLGKTVFSGNFNRLIDFLQVANSTFEESVGAADSWMSINVPFNDNQVVLQGVDGDNITFTVNDNLSGLAFFRAFVTVTEDVEEDE